MERVNIGTIPSAYQHQLVELLRSHQQVFAHDGDDVGLNQTVKHRIYTSDKSSVKAVWWPQIRPVQDSYESGTATVTVPGSYRARIRLCY